MTVKRLILFGVIGLVVLAIIFTLIFSYILNNKEGNEKKVDYYEFNLDEMYTNVAESESILKINITVEYTDEKLIKTLDKSRTKIVDNILEVLGSKTKEELLGKESRKKIRADILNNVKKITKSNNISNIYFTELIIQ